MWQGAATSHAPLARHQRPRYALVNEVSLAQYQLVKAAPLRPLETRLAKISVPQNDSPPSRQLGHAHFLNKTSSFPL